MVCICFHFYLVHANCAFGLDLVLVCVVDSDGFTPSLFFLF